jgi:endonuclease/exonuclease/phosphatase family metal-dependent hydrolase
MRRILLLFMILGVVYSTKAQSLSAMTYNIRYATTNDGDNQWEKRKEFLTDQISFYAPDIFGIQEGLQHQVDFIDEQLAMYDFIGVGRDDGDKKGEYCAIFYNKKKLDLLGQSTFWLSTSPEKVSVGWDAAMERICTYGFFMEKETGAMFWVFNTHFDHIGVLAREKSSELIVQKIREINKDNLPVILMGDFNLNDQSKAIIYLSSSLNDSRNISLNSPFGPYGTFTGFKFHEPVKDRIDYIFCSKENIQVEKYAVLTDSKGSKYPSDHFPVYVEVKFIK